jgi:hypothetical protein
MRRAIHIRSDLKPPLLDKVVMHEAAHAIAESWGLLPRFREMVAEGDIIGADEWAAQFAENHAIETANAASEILGRPVCIRGLCHGGWNRD